MSGIRKLMNKKDMSGIHKLMNKNTHFITCMFKVTKYFHIIEFCKSGLQTTVVDTCVGKILQNPQKGSQSSISLLLQYYRSCVPKIKKSIF